MKRFQLSVLLLFIIGLGSVFGQVTLIPDPSITNPGDCVAITEASSLSFIRDMSCGGSIRITNALIEDIDNDDLVITDSMGNEITAPIPSGVSEFTVSFLVPGEYLVLCNGSIVPRPGPEIDDVAACIIANALVPTLSEWSIIVLSLLFLVLTTVAIKTKQTSAQLSEVIT